ncbi:MAG: thermonuclease family protein [Kiritimatiellae bacterium]|nr:thermonuclease family protein [Kiritimatiellia bacterium]
MKRVAHVVFLVAMAVCAVALGRTFHRSFRNGYPAEWNVSKDEAEPALPLSQRSVRLGGPIEPEVRREIVGVVSRVTAGDTIWVADVQKVRRKIRLYGIEAPKANAAFGGESVARLQTLVGGKPVRVTYVARDPYGCILGTVWLDGADINLQMVREGLARQSRYSKDKRYAAAQAAARTRRVGVWSDIP